MKSNRQRKQPRYAVLHRLQAAEPVADLIWKQYGAALVEQYSREEWPSRLTQVPLIYRPVITRRLIREFGYTVEA